MTGSCDRRWFALYVECLGVLMIVLDSTIVNVALSSIRRELHFSDRGLAWVVSGYMIPYGGFLLLGGRLGDYYGRRSLFVGSIALFAAASLLCGLAQSQTALLVGRVIQGLGAALVLPVALSLILGQFEESSERAKAIGVFSLACACGGGAGLLLGGILAATFGWRWNFLVNIPIGAAVCILCCAFTSADEGARGESRLNIPGAIAVSASLLLAAYATARVSELGWLSGGVLIPMLGAAVLLFTFTFIEVRATEPLIPRVLLNDRHFAPALLAGLLWAAAQAMWFYLCSLYLQDILRFNSLQVGLTFLPFNASIGVMSWGVTAALIERFGVRLPFCVGVLCCVAGMLFFSRIPANAPVGVQLLPGMILLGVGAGLAYNPLVLGAVGGLREADYGAASGVLNSCFAMGSALSVAFFSSFASSFAAHVPEAAQTAPAALLIGYRTSFRVGAVLTGIAALLGVTLPHAIGKKSQASSNAGPAGGP